MIYPQLITLKKFMETTSPLIHKILSTPKEDFAKNDSNIHIAIGIINELKDILFFINEEDYILSNELYTLITPIKKYSNNLFSEYKIVNSYKLYDCFKINFMNLSCFLNTLGE